MALRQSAGFVTPLKPLEPGDRWVLFAQRGTYEFAFHVDDAFRYIAHGVEVFGKLLPCTAVDVLPFLNAIQVRAQDPDREMGFVDASQVIEPSSVPIEELVSA